MNKIVGALPSTVLVGVLLAPTSSLHAQSNPGVSGAICNPNTPTDSDKLIYNVYGVGNTSSNNADVACPVQFGSGQFVDSIQARVYDRASPADVCCTFMVLAQIGDGEPIPAATATKCSSGVDADIQLLDHNLPDNTFLSPYIVVECRIPGEDTGGRSHVTTIIAS